MNELTVNVLLSHYFDKHNVRREGGLQRIQEETQLSMNQIEFILRNLSRAYSAVFSANFKEPMTDGNLIQYGFDAFLNREISESQNRIRITMEFKKFIKDNRDK